MYLQEFNVENFFTPILDIGVLASLVILMLVMYRYYRIFPLILLIALMSLIIGMVSIDLQYNPFSPYIQIFFILFQTVFFLKTAIDYFNMKQQADTK